jgi:uncharacterized protein
LEDRAWKTARAFGRTIRESPTAHTQMMVGLDFAIGPSFEVVISGHREAQDTRAMLDALRSRFIPNKAVLLRPDDPDGGELARLAAFTQSQTSIDDKATAYVCQNFRCNLPTTDATEMLKQLGASV